MKRLSLFGVLSLIAGPAFAAVISMDSLIDVVIWLLIAGCVYWLVIWVIGQIDPPEPFNKIIHVVVAVVVFVIVVNALLSLIGHSFVSFR